MFDHLSQVYKEELSSDSSSISRRDSSQPPGTEPKLISIFSLLFSPTLSCSFQIENIFDVSFAYFGQAMSNNTWKQKPDIM